jgi:hypothetical protein
VHVCHLDISSGQDGMAIPWVIDFTDALLPFTFVYIIKSKVHSSVHLKETNDGEENVPFSDGHNCNKLGADCVCALKNGGHYAYIECGHLHSRFLSKVYSNFRKCRFSI